MQTGAESSSLFCSIVYPAKNLSNSYMIAVRVVGLSSAVEQTDGAERNRKGSCPNPFWKYYWYGCRHCVRSLYLEKIAFSRDNLVPLFSHPSTSLCFIHKPLHPPHAPSYHPPPLSPCTPARAEMPTASSGWHFCNTFCEWSEVWTQNIVNLW